MGVRDRAREILSVVPPLGQQINSNGPTAALFTKLTGMTQKTLEDNWATGGHLTCCNAFTGWYSKELGSPLYLGRFDLDTFLPKNGKGDSWIPSAPDRRPKYGDICRFAKFHVGVSLDFEGDMWNHADGGQGGRSMGFDVIKRKCTPWDPNTLMGWVDIEKYFGEESAPEPVEQAGPVPDWLLGWWNVKWRGQAFYYYFDRQYKVSWTQAQPRDTTRPAMLINDTGQVAVDSPSGFSINWGATGSVEKFEKSLGDMPMRGVWNDKEPLAAVKM